MSNPENTTTPHQPTFSTGTLRSRWERRRKKKDILNQNQGNSYDSHDYGSDAANQNSYHYWTAVTTTPTLTVSGNE